MPNVSCTNTLGSGCTIVSAITPSEPNGDLISSGAPSDGVITKFRIRAAAEHPGQITFRVADVTPSADRKTATATVAGTGPTVTCRRPHRGMRRSRNSPGAAGQAGPALAVDETEVEIAANLSGGPEFSYLFAPSLVEGRGAQGSSEVTGELLVQATLEPDADHDGFGDETQDMCPTQARTQGPCDLTPPAVSGLKVRGGKVSYSLSEASTVSLLLEKKLAGRRVAGKCVAQTRKNRAKPRCPRFRAIGRSFSAAPATSAPDSVALPGRLGPGVYRLTLSARDAAGNQTVQATTFTVKPKSKHRHKH